MKVSRGTLALVLVLAAVALVAAVSLRVVLAQRGEHEPKSTALISREQLVTAFEDADYPLERQFGSPAGVLDAT
jgi:hypothetical protein